MKKETRAPAPRPTTALTGAFLPRPSPGALVLTGVIAFILVFTYLSLNLKNVDFGYEKQELAVYRGKLLEEIDRLKSLKAQLLNLKRVEKEVMEKLGYRYPEPDQFIKVFVSGAGD